MLSPLVRQQIAHVLEITLVLIVIAGIAAGLTFLEDLCETRQQHLWLCQIIRVVSMYSIFVGAVIFCTTITIVGIRLIRNMGKP
jgi:hypothetical protein